MKTILKLFVGAVLCALLALCIVTFVLPDTSFSENENRMLKTKATLSHNVLDGSLQTDFEDYLSDQMPWRTFCIRLQTMLKLLVGRRDVGGAYLGENGRLFQKITDADVAWDELSAHAARYARLAVQTNLPLTLLPVPSAGCMTPELLPPHAQMYDLNRCFFLIEAAAPGATLVDTRSALGLWNAYYATDHHWTTQGAYSAYRAWCFAHGKKPQALSAFSPQTVTEDFRGTLFSKVPGANISGEAMTCIDVPASVTVVADGKTVPFYDDAALATKDKYNVFLSGNHGIVEIENPSCENNGVLLLLKDSFANSLVPFLIYDYRKIVLIDERYTAVVLSDYAAEIGATEIAVVKEAAFF